MGQQVNIRCEICNKYERNKVVIMAIQKMKWSIEEKTNVPDKPIIK
jgi:hypothetical protein